MEKGKSSIFTEEIIKWQKELKDNYNRKLKEEQKNKEESDKVKKTDRNKEK